MQIHTGVKDNVEQKASFNKAKAENKKKPRQTKQDKKQSNN